METRNFREKDARLKMRGALAYVPTGAKAAETVLLFGIPLQFRRLERVRPVMRTEWIGGQIPRQNNLLASFGPPSSRGAPKPQQIPAAADFNSRKKMRTWPKLTYGHSYTYVLHSRRLDQMRLHRAWRRPSACRGCSLATRVVFALPHLLRLRSSCAHFRICS